MENLSKYQPTSRDAILIAVFGALWGLMEISLGVVLKGLRLPMGGAILTAIACPIFLTGRYFVRKKGSIIMMGTIAAILKIFSVGTVIAGPFMAILIESILAEILISFLGIHRLSYVIIATLLIVYTIIHPFIAQGIIFGDNIYKIYLETFKKIADLMHIDIIHLSWIIMVYITIHLILGISSGWFAFSLAIGVKKELNKSVDQ